MFVFSHYTHDVYKAIIFTKYFVFQLPNILYINFGNSLKNLLGAFDLCFLKILKTATPQQLPNWQFVLRLDGFVSKIK